MRVDRAGSLARNHRATTLQMASVFEPLLLASRCAAIVSAVSPDCEIKIVIVSLRR